MDTEIICETVVEAGVLEKLTALLRRFGTELILESGERFSVSRPPSAVVLQSPADIDATRKRLARFREGVAPAYSLYGDMVQGGPASVSRILEPLPPTHRGGPFGFWIRVTNQVRLPSGIDLRPDQGYIFLCPERIAERAVSLSLEMVERPTAGVAATLLGVVLEHEMGHHFSLINLSNTSFLWLSNHNDLNFAEGLANWFAVGVAPKLGRWMVAELATLQEVRYRYYHALRSANLGTVLKPLMCGDDPQRAVFEFARLIGGKLDLNGHQMTIRSEAKGLFLDWSGRGGTLTVGGHLEALGPYYGAVVLAGRIDRLLGRFPSSTVILTNGIGEALDYGKLPPNIRVIPPAELDITSELAAASEAGLDSLIRNVFAKYGTAPQAEREG